jgi:hypothetical protein
MHLSPYHFHIRVADKALPSDMGDYSAVHENQLLAALPPEALERLLPSLESVLLPPGILQRAGLIEYHGTRLTIVNREQLESVACGCYWVVKRQSAKVLDPVKRRSPP